VIAHAFASFVHAYGTIVLHEWPNGLRFTHAALIERNHALSLLDANIAAASLPQSGVGW